MSERRKNISSAEPIDLNRKRLLNLMCSISDTTAQVNPVVDAASRMEQYLLRLIPEERRLKVVPNNDSDKLKVELLPQ